MNKSTLYYFKKSKDIVHKEGFFAFIKKASRHLRMVFDKAINKIFSKFYIKGFHKLYYYSTENTLLNTYWLGTPARKCPLDMWIYQEIIWETKPDIIIETGTAKGGSALFFASMCDLLKKGRVVTVDLFKCDVSHPRIVKIVGDSVSDEVINKIKKITRKKTAMVVLDSDHSKKHVLKEMEEYGKLVSVGNYLVVEDTNINGHPVQAGEGAGPMEAVKEFLHKRKDFVLDRSREKFFLTFFPKGFLKRVK